MRGKYGERDLRQRIQSGEVLRQDVTRRLAELAFGHANDCVKLALDWETDLDDLDLSLLAEVRRNEKGTVEVKLIDRLRVLEQLAALTETEASGIEVLLEALKEGDEA